MRMFFSIFLYDFEKKKKKNFVNERNVTIEYVFVTWFHIKHKNISGVWINSFTVIALIFVWKRYFQKR